MEVFLQLTHQILFLDTGLFDCPETIFRNTPEDYGRFPHEYDCTLYHACYKVNRWHIPRENMAHCTFKNVARFYSVCVGLIKIIYQIEMSVSEILNIGSAAAGITSGRSDMLLSQKM